MLIRPLDAIADLDAVVALYRKAADYWLLADRRAPDRQKAADFFTDGPPGCDPGASWRLGAFQDGALIGVAELSFGFPQAGDAYLGLMLLDPAARGSGLGVTLLADITARARAAHAPNLYLAVLQANPRGRAFWQREGFRPTGLSGTDSGHILHRLVKPL